MLFHTVDFAQPVSKSYLKENFKNPPFEYRAILPFQGAGGADYKESASIQHQLNNIYNNYGFGGIMVAPTNDQSLVGKQISSPGYMKHIGSGLQAKLPKGASPWLMTLPKGIKPYRYISSSDNLENSKPAPLPSYLSKAYFDQLRQILSYSKERGRKVVFYDEIGYPSGIANHSTPDNFRRKRLEKEEEIFIGPKSIQKTIANNGILMAVVAMNTSTLERIDLTQQIKNNTLNWQVPLGSWNLMVFSCVTTKKAGGGLDYCAATDFLDPETANWFVQKVYDPLAKEVGSYFGNTMFQTFFDDVGIFDEEQTWTTKFNEKFRSRFGINPAIYYPALWQNIGPETEAARVAFFDTRAELLANGFPKVISDWGAKNHIQVSGHCPGNYDPQPVDMNGDPFKFYRAQPIPMVDVIFSYPTGRDGFKLISDGANYYDKPIVAAETFSPFSPPGEKEGYRRLMELYVRGINRLMGSGFPKSDSLKSKTSFAEWVGRSSLMLQGGKRVSDIAIFYPIADLEAFYHFNAPEYTKEMRWGTFVPQDNDYLSIGEMLLGYVHRDFTFLHPDFLLSEKIKIKGPILALENKVNSQNYRVLILPGQKVISLKALQKIKAYFDQGGAILATSLLPSKASELSGNEHTAISNNLQVQKIIKDMFGVDATQPMPEGITAIKKNKMNGRAVFIRKPEGKILAGTIDQLGISPDVVFEGNPSPSSAGGMLSYTHQKKDGRDIYFFANSSDDAIETFVDVKGIIRPELWDPTNGIITPVNQTENVNKNGQNYTRFPLKLNAVTTVFVVSAK
jgi:hypothetical protein